MGYQTTNLSWKPVTPFKIFQKWAVLSLQNIIFATGPNLKSDDSLKEMITIIFDEAYIWIWEEK